MAQRFRSRNPCASCGQPVKRPASTYCSNECQYDRWVDAWVRGEGEMPTAQRAKRILRKMHDNACQECKWNVVHPNTGKVPLQMDHIDGDNSNNAFGNLRLLCPNCHALTPNFGSRNSNKLRARRGEPPVVPRGRVRERASTP
jgi:endogenous inhibitor of DNA gyrase (YacG/DUF329 family)